MSGATYRIEVTHDPHSEMLPWDARIYRVSDDAYQWSVCGSTADQAEAEAREWIAAENAKDATQRVFFVDDEGNDAEVPAPQSVKA